MLCAALAQPVGALPQPVRPIVSIRLLGATDVDTDYYADGKRLLAASDVAGALAMFKLALAAAPGSVDALNGIAVSYDQLGRGDLARGFYDAALVIDPGSPRLLNNLGYSLLLHGDGVAAALLLQAAATSTDVDAANAARATLAKIDQQTSARRPPDLTDPAPEVSVEITDAGEQRLVFAASERTLSPETALAVVAEPWTADDDAALLARGKAQAGQVAVASTNDRACRGADCAMSAVAVPDAAVQDNVETTVEAALPGPAVVRASIVFNLHSQPSAGERSHMVSNAPAGIFAGAVVTTSEIVDLLAGLGPHENRTDAALVRRRRSPTESRRYQA